MTLFAGLSVTYLVFYLMNGHGQPALLYLVPCTLGDDLDVSTCQVLLSSWVELEEKLETYGATEKHHPKLFLVNKPKRSFTESHSS
ncbi:hypothetical protein GW17_00048027 [Ensete ventricosum]|nr:hypothetical protein GW17_00048027 [Ensete ventricosum]